MSTDTCFIVETRKKGSNKWKPIKVYDRTYHERKMILLTKNYPGFRSCMDFSFSNFKDRGLPLDVSKEVKDFLTEQKEEYGCWGISYISFSELYSMISHENKEMVLSLEKYGINHTTISLLKGIMDYLKNNNSSTFDDAIKDLPLISVVLSSIINHLPVKTNYFSRFSVEIPRCPYVRSVTTRPLGVLWMKPFLRR